MYLKLACIRKRVNHTGALMSADAASCAARIIDEDSCASLSAAAASCAARIMYVASCAPLSLAVC